MGPLGNVARLLALVAVCVGIVGCKKRDSAGTPSSSGPDANQPAPAAIARGADDALGEPKASIAYQLKLLQAGDAPKLKECFTPRLKEKITKELVASAQKTAAQMTVDDLVQAIQPGEYEGKKTAKITMKNGRTLTTLILTDGKWLSDTIWFK